MIQVKNLHKYYNKGKKNEQHVLNDVSLELDRTGLVCILGESGSGKTTLLNTIGGLDTFADGSIIIDDKEVKKYNPKVMEPIRNDHFDYIFQNYYLLKDYTVGYNIKIALNRYKLTEEEKEERVDYVLKMLGIEKYKKKNVSKLSGGQQQRVSIARALVKSPDVIFADEPTGNLDEENTLRTMSILKNISKECLVLLVTHEKRIAKFFADRIIEVCDGKVVRDEPNTPLDTYERSDDSNIYLRELDRQDVSGDLSDFHIYTDKLSSPKKIELSLAWKDGKLYIQNHTDCDILIEGIENGVQMLDEERPTLDMDEVDNFSYDLEKMESRGSAHLGGREVLRMALENIQLMGKKQAFIITIFLVSAVLLSVTMAQFFSSFTINEEKVVGTDSHYVSLIFTNTASRRSMDDRMRVMDFIEEFFSDDKNGTPFFIPSASIYLTGSGYKQLNNLTQQIENYSFVNKEHLKQEQILYGHKPEKLTDVVIDKRVIATLARTKTSVASLHETDESYLGMKITISSVDTQFTVVGVCDSQQPSIYVSQNVLMGINAKGYKVANIEEFHAEIENNDDLEEKGVDTSAYDNISLADDEIMVRETLYTHLEDKETVTLGDDGIQSFKVKGTFPDGLGFDYVLSDGGCKAMRNVIIYENKVAYIYCENPEATYKLLEDKGTGYGGGFTPTLSIPSQDEIKEYKEKHSTDMDAKTLIPVAIAFISLIMVYFTVKSNATSRSEELTVYRLIGISRGSILRAYILEMVLVTSYTSLPAVLATCGVMKFISSVPSLEIDMAMPWWAAVLLVFGLYAVHSLISILPVYGILSKPPATLAVKE